MNIAYSIYALEASHSLNAASKSSTRKGALLRVEFNSGKIGFADCHPWPELGDLPLEEQLGCLAQGQFTPNTRCALEFAELDAEYRALGKSVLNNQLIPRSHFLMTNLMHVTPQDVQSIHLRGFTHVKLKMGRNIDNELERLHALFSNTPLRVRLDFNETLQQETFYTFLEGIKGIKNCIDFIEDPFPFDASEWTAIQEKGWTLACDRQACAAWDHPQAAKILIIKPAVQSFALWRECRGRSCIVTTYLGHPLEQAAAAYVASQIDPFCSSVHGLLSHHAYRPNLFSYCLNWQNADFLAPVGLGFGFDRELDRLEWEKLS